MLQPSSTQRIIASGQLVFIFRLIVSIASALCALWYTHFPIETIYNVQVLAGLGLLMLVSFGAGWFASLIIAWVIFGPIFLAQSTKNGGPFQIGDTVQIITGEFGGKVTSVYAKWQHGTNRVELGPTPKEKFEDIYADHQLLRVEISNDSKNCVTAG